MEFITTSYCKINRATPAILAAIERHYSMNQVYTHQIQPYIEDFMEHLRDDINVMIEYPYVDKVYRDSYYTYFATKYNNYSRECIRLSFFEKQVKEADIIDSTDAETLSKLFLGYCVIRPTFPHVIGRNLISKRALQHDDFVTCIHREDVLINGKKLPIEGFPHSSQDQESITCAETTIWALMEYFGHRYAEYKPVLPSVIINRLNEHSDKRMLPSNGLTTEQISYALKDFGFGSMIYTRADDKTEFLPTLSVYIESGFPVIVAIENKEIAHAILMIGRQNYTTQDLTKAFRNNKSRMIPFSACIKSYIVQDDNLNPYSSITLSRPTTGYGESSLFARSRITAFVVPLYRKMYMDAPKAKRFFQAIIADPEYGTKSRQQHIFRMYMASSRSFKEHIGSQKLMDNTLRKILLSVSMPRFIWCGEFINRTDAAAGTVSSLVVLDATEGGENWADSFIFAAHKTKTLFYGLTDESNHLVPLSYQFSAFKMYDHNLN